VVITKSDMLKKNEIDDLLIQIRNLIRSNIKKEKKKEINFLNFS
jgi:hypothetical protein